MRRQAEVLYLYNLTVEELSDTSYQLIFLSVVSDCSEVLCRKILPVLFHYYLLNCLIIVLSSWCASAVLFYFYRQKVFSVVKKPT